MLDVLTPTDHTDAYTWAAVLLSHSLLGAIAWGAFGWIMSRTDDILMSWQESAFYAVTITYFFAWEIGVQQVGASWSDAFIDTIAWSCGALMAWGLWANRARLVGAAVAVLALFGVVGVWRRRNGS